MTDAVEAHLEAVREMSREGVLAPEAPTATINNPDWWVNGYPTDQRERLHERILTQVVADGRAGHDRQAIVMAGPPGAGKSFARAQVLEGRSESFLVIDPDEFKKALLEAAVEDGSYESWIMPPEVRERIAAGDQFFPLDHASLVHEESSHLAHALRDDSIATGRNILIDGVMGDDKKAQQLVEGLRAAGYSITVVDVEVPLELSEARVRTRFARDYEAAVAGEPGHELGGRPVPSEFYQALYDRPDGRSRPEAAAASVAESCPAVREYRRYRTTGTDVTASPVLEAHRTRVSYGALLVDEPVPGVAGSRGNVTRATPDRPGPQLSVPPSARHEPEVSRGRS